MQPIERVNDFVVKFANVNGSGSASANNLFAKAVLRMGVPVAARNIFPSNIQGMPTWYEVRVVEAGWRGRRGGVDLMVAMNAETWSVDVAEIEQGGYLFYDSTKPLPHSRMREDITAIGMPLTGICQEMYQDARQRQLFKNVMYVGGLAALLDMEAGVVEALLASQYGGERKAPLLEANRGAFRRGYDYAKEHLPAIGLRLARRDAVGERIFIDGNSASGLGAVYGGATVCAWYPITPSTSVAEAFQGYCRKFRVDRETGGNRYAFVQAEDELASIGMVVGAGWNGARAFTATSGPGISLMQEFIGLAYFAEIPAVLFDVQRGSPSTGMPTKTQQADVLCAAYASHGDTKHVLLFPEDPTECFEMGARAFDLADRLQTPVFVMLDLDIGMQDWLTAPFEWDDAAAPRPRQGDDRRGPGGGARVRALPRRRRRRRSLPHLAGHAPEARRLLHPGHFEGPARPLHRGGPGLRRQHAAPAAQVRDGEVAGARAGDREGRAADAGRRALVRLDRRADGRGARRPGGARHPPRPDARARVPLRRQRGGLRRRARARVRRRAEPRRAAAHAADDRVRHRPG